MKLNKCEMDVAEDDRCSLLAQSYDMSGTPLCGCEVCVQYIQALQTLPIEELVVTGRIDLSEYHEYLNS